MTVHFFPAELSAVGSVKCFHLPSSGAVLNYYGPVMSVAKVLEASDCFLDPDIGKSPACHTQRGNIIFLGFGVRCDTHFIISCLFTSYLGYKRLIWHDRFLSITDILILRELLNCWWIISNRVNLLDFETLCYSKYLTPSLITFIVKIVIKSYWFCPLADLWSLLLLLLNLIWSSHIVLHLWYKPNNSLPEFPE